MKSLAAQNLFSGQPGSARSTPTRASMAPCSPAGRRIVQVRSSRPWHCRCPPIMICPASSKPGAPSTAARPYRSTRARCSSVPRRSSSSAATHSLDPGRVAHPARPVQPAHGGDRAMHTPRVEKGKFAIGHGAHVPCAQALCPSSARRQPHLLERCQLMGSHSGACRPRRSPRPTARRPWPARAPRPARPGQKTPGPTHRSRPPLSRCTAAPSGSPSRTCAGSWSRKENVVARSRIFLETHPLCIRDLNDISHNNGMARKKKRYIKDFFTCFIILHGASADLWSCHSCNPRHRPQTTASCPLWARPFPCASKRPPPTSSPMPSSSNSSCTTELNVREQRRTHAAGPRPPN